MYQQEVWAILSSSSQQLHIHRTVCMEVLESQLPSFIHRGSVWHLYGNEDMIFQQHQLLHTPRKSSQAHENRRGAFKCSIGQPTVPT